MNDYKMIEPRIAKLLTICSGCLLGMYSLDDCAPALDELDAIGRQLKDRQNSAGMRALGSKLIQFVVMFRNPCKRNKRLTRAATELRKALHRMEVSDHGI